MAIDGLLNAGEIVTKALRIMGVVNRQGAPSTAQLDEGLETLNWLLKSLQLDHIHLWRQETKEIAVPASTQAFTLDPRPVDVYNARIKFTASDYERPMSRLSLDDFLILPTKSLTGTVVLYSIRKSANSTDMLFWPIPNVAATVVYDFARVIDDITATGDAVDILQEWTEGLFYLLAERLLSSYGLAEISPSTSQYIALRAQDLRRRLEDADRPSYFSYGPGWGHGYKTSNGYR